MQQGGIKALPFTIILIFGYNSLEKLLCRLGGPSPQSQGHSQICRGAEQYPLTKKHQMNASHQPLLLTVPAPAHTTLTPAKSTRLCSDGFVSPQRLSCPCPHGHVPQPLRHGSHLRLPAPGPGLAQTGIRARSAISLPRTQTPSTFYLHLPLGSERFLSWIRLV